MVVHIGGNKDVRVLITKEDLIFHIKGYLCKKNCKDCPLYKVGDHISLVNEPCGRVDENNIIMDFKIDSTLTEEITFV